MRVVRCINTDSINLVSHFIEHHTKIRIGGRAFPCCPFWKVVAINIAKCDNVLALTPLVGKTCNSSSTNHRNVNLTIGRWTRLSNREPW